MANPPVLMPPQKRKPLSLDLTTTIIDMGAMLAQIVDAEERAIYYISKNFHDYELRYTPVEKGCLALLWATGKLRYYMLAHEVHVYSKMDPIRYIFNKHILNGRISRWTLLLSEYNLSYVPLKSIKGRAVSDFLADYAITEESTSDTTALPDDNIFNIDNETWKLYFDGASSNQGYGIGILLISPEGEHIPISIKLEFTVTNNVAEYEACLHGLKVAISLNTNRLKVYGDSSLIINQVIGNWKIKNETLALYQEYIDKIIDGYFDHIEFIHIFREDNQFADALSKLASLINMPDELRTIHIFIERSFEPGYIGAIEEDESQLEPWYQTIINYKTAGEYPPDTSTRGKRAIRALSSQFIYKMGQLFKKTPQGTLLTCVDFNKGQKIISEVHNGHHHSTV